VTRIFLLFALIFYGICLEGLRKPQTQSRDR